MNLPQPTRFSISVIIATLCESKRKTEILRAIASIQKQKNVISEIHIVVNGTRFDASLLEELKSRTDVKTYYQSISELPEARVFGRKQVTQEFFAYLDDDDEFFENSFEPILQILKSNLSVDLVVSNGVKKRDEIEYPLYTNMDPCRKDPLKELFNQSWLNSSCAIYRASSIGVEYFEKMEKYFEWTSFAFELAVSKKIEFRDEYLNRINDTVGSLSKSKEFLGAEVPFLKRIELMKLRPELQNALSRKFSNAYHDMSDLHMRNGQLLLAWIFHFKSLKSRYGYRYIFFTRKLIGLNKVFRGIFGI